MDTPLTVYAVGLDAGSALAPTSLCAGCGAERLTAVTDSKRTSLSCGSCGPCLQAGLGLAHRADSQGLRDLFART